jgi:hypothetical protein
MKTELKIYTVEQICDGFEYNELEGKGLYGLAGKADATINGVEVYRRILIRFKK